MTDQERKRLRAAILRILGDDHGPNNPITMTALWATATGGIVVPWKRYDQSRVVRSLIAELRAEGHPIGHKGGTGGGYFLATTDAELQPTIDLLVSRGLASLTTAAALRRISLDELVQQLHLDLTTTPQQEADQ